MLRTGGTARGEAETLLRGILGHDEALSERLASFGAPQADPRNVVASFNERLRSSDPLMRSLSRRLLRRELDAAGVPVDSQLAGRPVLERRLDAGAGARLEEAFRRRGADRLRAPRNPGAEPRRLLSSWRGRSTPRASSWRREERDRPRVNRTGRSASAGEYLKVDAVLGKCPDGGATGETGGRGVHARLAGG